MNLRWKRIIPVAFLMYSIAYMDRINISLALPYMSKALGMTATIAGLASGIFFIGYLVLQIPGGYLATRWSAKKLVMLLLFVWGLFAILTGVVQNETQLLIVRFLLGVAEGGVWPATLVILSQWFPKAERTRANGFWMLNLPLSAAAMSSISGWVLGTWGWRGLFVIEGLVPWVWALVWWLAIADSPSDAVWLSQGERDYIHNAIARDDQEKSGVTVFTLRDALQHQTVLLLAISYFFLGIGTFGFALWLPSILKAIGHLSPTTLGLVTAIPFVVAAGGMAVVSSWSDKSRRRVPYVSGPLIIGAIALLVGILFRGQPMMGLVLLSITAVGLFAPLPPLWAIPTDQLPRSLVGPAYGLINLVGNVGAFVGPFLVGYIQTITRHYTWGLVSVALAMALSALFAALTRGKSAEIPQVVAANR